VSTAKPSAAVTSSRSEFVDSGQPILLSGGSPAETGTQANAGAPDAPMAADSTATAAAVPADAPRMATAMVEPSTADIAPPAPQPEVMSAGEAAVPAMTSSGTGGPFVDPASAEVLSDGPAGGTAISASAKAKLVGELQALKKRPGVGSAAAAAATDDCPEGSLEPQCLAAAD
jgi:hypothetical protein